MSRKQLFPAGWSGSGWLPWPHRMRVGEQAGMAFRFHTLRQEQWIPRPIGEVFAFFADAKNLETITPPFLGFRILSVSATAIAQGTKIRYRLRLHGLPIYWLTDIRRWDPPFRFVDVQLSGPYRMWHHTHTFEDHGSRTRMTDVVRYTLPFGPLGELVHALKVRADVARVFDYRRQRVAELFGEAPAQGRLLRFQSGSVPGGTVGGCFIGGLKEGKQGCIGIGRLAHGFIGE